MLLPLLVSLTNLLIWLISTPLVFRVSARWFPYAVVGVLALVAVWDIALVAWYVRMYAPPTLPPCPP